MHVKIQNILQNTIVFIFIKVYVSNKNKKNLSWILIIMFYNQCIM